MNGGVKMDLDNVKYIREEDTGVIHKVLEVTPKTVATRRLGCTNIFDRENLESLIKAGQLTDLPTE